MIDAQRFIGAARERDFALYAGVPCSYLKPFINHVIDAPELRYIGAANEGDAVAIAAGAELGGMPAVAMFQNSGLGNAVNPLTSLTWAFRIPVLLIATLRGEPGGAPDEPQHRLMGGITASLLELMDIPWSWFPDRDAAVDATLDEALAYMATEQRPYALLMRKGSVGGSALESGPAHREPVPATPGARVASHRRAEILRAVQSAARPEDVLVATTGFTGRELYACADHPNQLYMVGSMGCAVSLGLGLAVARPDRRVIVLDGDGAALMRLGALATTGYERPANLVHILLDNGIHESTGGQATVSASIDFCAIATACGYPQARREVTPDAVARELAASGPGLKLIHVPILPGIDAGLPRPSIQPEAVARRLKTHLADPVGPT